MTGPRQHLESRPRDQVQQHPRVRHRGLGIVLAHRHQGRTANLAQPRPGVMGDQGGAGRAQCGAGDPGHRGDRRRALIVGRTRSDQRRDHGRRQLGRSHPFGQRLQPQVEPLVRRAAVQPERGAAVQQRQGPNHLGVLDRQVLRHHAPHRQPDHVDRPSRDPADQAGSGSGQSDERVRQPRRGTVARHVPGHAAADVGQSAQLGFPADPRTTQAMQEQRDRAGSELPPGNRGPVDIHRRAHGGRLLITRFHVQRPVNTVDSRPTGAHDCCP